MSMSHQNQSNAAMDGYSQVLWEPDEKSRKNSNLSSFLYSKPNVNDPSCSIVLLLILSRSNRL